MTYEEQLELWVYGKSVHNSDLDICCPDFSCCNKNVNTPIEERKAYFKAYKIGDEKTISTFLMGYLGQALATLEPDLKVHLTDGEYGDEPDC